MREEQIESLQEYIGFIDSIGMDFSISRGQKEDYLLLPGALRKTGSNRKYSKMDVASFMNDFRMESIYYLNSTNELKSDYDLMVYAQHYGLPTYLLDFTYSHIISLTFAVENAFDFDDSDEEKCAVVWFVNPEGINLVSIREKNIINMSKEEKDFDKPIFVCGNKSNSRLYAQNGIFAYFNEGSEPLNEYKEYSEYLIKVKIPYNSCKKILSNLYKLGIRNINLYPELSAISKDILLKNNVIEFLKEVE